MCIVRSLSLFISLYVYGENILLAQKVSKGIIEIRIYRKKQLRYYT